MGLGRRNLVLDSTFIEVSDDSSAGSKPIRLNREVIRSYRFGITRLKGLWFPVGKKYEIVVRAETGTIKLNFKSFYGRKEQEYDDVYDKILQLLWDFYFDPIADRLLQQFYEGSVVEIEGVQLTRDVVRFPVRQLFRDQMVEIRWEDLGTRDYFHYFAIYSSSDPVKVHATFNYLKDWNVTVLYGVIRTVLEDRFPGRG